MPLPKQNLTLAIGIEPSGVYEVSPTPGSPRGEYREYDVRFLVRLKQWISQVKHAMVNLPPKKDTRVVVLYPGDAGYEKAPLNYYTSSITYSDNASAKA